MNKRIIRFGLGSLLAAALLPASAHAQPVAAGSPAQSRATIIRPLTLLRTADMDFATIGVTTGGTATINPLTGAMTVSPGLLHLGGTPSAAHFEGAAVKRTVVIIRVPKQPVLIRRIGGTETLAVRDFTLDGQDKKTLAASESFEFAVGATIVVPAGTVEGVYEGDINVTVQYP